MNRCFCAISKLPVNLRRFGGANIIKNITHGPGDGISESKVILESGLPNGTDFAAVIPPCSIHGVTLTIRKFNSRHFTIEDLVRMGILDGELAAGLEYVQNRQNILISGGTGSGRTTLSTDPCYEQ